MQIHTTTTVHTWSHTHTQSKSLTQTDTEQYSHTQRETDTHSCTQAPGDTEQWAHCLGWQQLGRKELQCGLRRPWGLLYPPPSPPQHPKPFPSSRSQLLLGPGFADGLCSQAAPAQPRRMSGGGCRGSPVYQAPFEALGIQGPSALMLHPPPGIIQAFCLPSPQSSTWKSAALRSALNL